MTRVAEVSELYFGMQHHGAQTTKPHLDLQHPEIRGWNENRNTVLADASDLDSTADRGLDQLEPRLWKAR